MTRNSYIRFFRHLHYEIPKDFVRVCSSLSWISTCKKNFAVEIFCSNFFWIVSSQENGFIRMVTIQKKSSEIFRGNPPLYNYEIFFENAVGQYEIGYSSPSLVKNVISYFIFHHCYYRYRVEGFMDKNKDTLFQDFKRLLFNWYEVRFFSQLC
jgi:hypothetical protein